MARRNARPTLHYRFVRWRTGKQFEKFTPQLRCGPEPAVGIEVIAKKPVACARDMPAHRIDCLVFPAKTIRATRIDHDQFRRGNIGQHIIGGHHPITLLNFKNSRQDNRNIPRQRTPLLDPAIEATIKHRDVIVTEPAQHPPQTPRNHAFGIIISNNLSSAGNSDSTEFRCQDLRVGQRMAAIASAHRPGKIAIEMHEKRTGQMPLGVHALAVAHIGKLVPTINDSPVRIVEMRRQLFTGNKRMRHHVFPYSDSSQA